MPIHLAPGESEDPHFIELLNSIVRGIIEETCQDFWIIQIDRWFDHKWLGFSGIGTVDFRFPAYMDRYDAALSQFYQEKVTFPPFTPNRILSQRFFSRVDGDYSEKPSRVAPHSVEKSHSEVNLQKRIETFNPSAYFVWYSAGTLLNGRASVMVYRTVEGRIETWFAAFVRDGSWKLLATKGADQQIIQTMLSRNGSSSR